MSTLHQGVNSSGVQSFRQLQQAGSKPHISPSILVIVIILSVVFICSGVLHVLARCLGRRRARAPAGDFNSPSNSIRGQLQHLFSLHDSGVEQVFIDALPVFLYGSIRGLKDSADCAVCLNEFANEDRLRLLPKCKHAFHVDCIDTWLLSNSTCPLCRRSLLLEVETTSTVVVDSNRESSPCEGAQVGSQRNSSFRGSFRASLRGSFRFLTDAVLPAPPEREILPNPSVVEEGNETPPMTPGPTVCVTKPDGSEKVMRVELGKVNTDSGRISRDVGSSAGPRCYSMGSYEYVVDFASLGLPQKPTHRSTLSDGTPELASASHTPGQEDMFWARRGLETPHNLSRVRELMTPPPTMKEDGGAGLAPSLSLRLFPVEDKIEACGGSSVQETVKKDTTWEVAVDVTVPSTSDGSGRSGSSSRKSSPRKSSPLDWLRGRGRRLVYSAASPLSADVQSPESKIG